MNRIVPLLILSVLAFLVFSSLGIEYGSPVREVSGHYIDNGVSETGALNMVTAVYLDYRLFDTLGEATVFFVATLGVFMLLKNKDERDENE